MENYTCFCSKFSRLNTMLLYGMPTCVSGLFHLFYNNRHITPKHFLQSFGSNYKIWKRTYANATSTTKTVEATQKKENPGQELGKLK